ncbi:type VI secretion system baseplate subunit TssF [Pseudomonas syringae]|nr:type VI secretion system baseplate subunit TssF [Pseudomonas syringae]MCF5466568.1 type VI secretion system baseplate subunit TssF [Pseudomonas syringae]MCF5471160.1 type VI secretion system baseplate subunit TssF [Pseudomonas syringae]MCF5482545.1 type VI secretion system baseplate subunit TssF [Pseudomonas syringae]MCF5486427.1 type VI secretion system baseplate subunit TssF [Pseudomonas syringae]MCF5491064.1 type VI secretion system baseplate subunit TssF [Pseudomonas syringae]
MSFNHYYQDELMALRQSGRRFSDRNPALAPFLGQGSQDPDVERLLEGFAFLTGRLRQKLDDDLPELTHSLMQLLWPNYMRPLPAMSMLQFEPLVACGPGLIVERDTPVESDPVNGLTCQFRTCFPTEVLPLRLTRVSYSASGEAATLALRLEMTGEGHLGELKSDRLRLHFAGDRYVSQMLYLGFMRKLKNIRLLLLDGHSKPLVTADGQTAEFSISPDNVKPVGFAEEEALIPYPLNTFRGYRYLQEYFCFPEKFLFVDVHGLDVIQSIDRELVTRSRGFQWVFDMRCEDMQGLRPTLEHIKLYCTPVVNLFKQDAVPIQADARQDEYLLMPGHYGSDGCGVYSVDKVTGWQPGGKGYKNYVPFESFEHDPAVDVESNSPYYSVRHRHSILQEGLDTFLSFDLRGDRKNETISIELTCTNHNLPQKIRAGGICKSCDGTPDFLQFRNIAPVTKSYAPPMTRDFLWRVISNMSLNYLSLASVEALKVILETYDLPRYYDKRAEKVSQHLLSGLKAIRHEHVDRLHDGRPLRGVKTELFIAPAECADEASLFLFASVLNEFFALYASLNSFHELHVKTDQGGGYEWTPRMGQQPLL